MPAILALGIFIGASLALASPLGSRVGTPAPRHIVEAGPEPTQGGGSGTASEGSCAEAVSYLAGGDWGLSRAIDAVLESCEGNPRAPGLVNAFAHLGANQEAHGSQPSQAGGGSSVGPQGGGGGGQPAPGDGSSDDGSKDAEPGDDGSEDAEPGDDGSEDDHGNSGHGDRDPNGNAYGHFDGKGNNG